MKIELTPEQIELILTMAESWTNDMYSNIEHPEDVAELEALVDSLKHQSQHACPSCKGKGWFIVLNDGGGDQPIELNHIERCDTCKVFMSDDDATDYALRSGQVEVLDGKYKYARG